MSELALTILLAVLGVIVGFFAGWFILKRIGDKRIANAEETAKKIIAEGEKEAGIKKKEALLEAREEWYKVKSNYEREIQNKKNDLQKLDRSLQDRQSNLDRKIESHSKLEKELLAREKTLSGREKGIAIRESELDTVLRTQNEKLERIAGMTADEAKKELKENLINEAKIEAAAMVKEIKEKAEQDAEKEAKEIIIGAIYRCAADQAVEATVSVVNLPSDEMKGRIIGREGRNIRSFETATAIDVIVDDTPEAVILSGYDPIRREIARMALEKLIADGRIHPTRIEEVVEKNAKRDGYDCPRNR